MGRTAKRVQTGRKARQGRAGRKDGEERRGLLSALFDKTAFTDAETPIYRQIANAIAAKIACGELVAGERLPPQRDIARQAGVNLTTVTRAFADLQERGLVTSRPGRGSMIAEGREAARFKSAPLDEQGYIDLSVNRPATTGYLEALGALLPRLPEDPRYAALQDFHEPEGPGWAREAVAGWLATQIGSEAPPERLLVTNGAQHGLSCVLSAIARPGDVILADAVTYQGIGALCRSLDLVLKPVEMDGEGMRPDAFARACAELTPRAVFLVPTLHNPTTVTLAGDRRRALAKTARSHGVLLIEDDVYRPLKDDTPQAFAASDPDITIHLGSFSKSIAPGLRFGAVLAPPALVGEIAAMLRINCWSTGPLTALIAARMIEGGDVGRILEGQKREFEARQVLVREMLCDVDLSQDPQAPHAWVHLPEPWHANAFVRAAGLAGVGVLSGEAFAISRNAVPHAVRINVGAARSRAQLREALTRLRKVLRDGRHLLEPVI